MTSNNKKVALYPTGNVPHCICPPCLACGPGGQKGGGSTSVHWFGSSSSTCHSLLSSAFRGQFEIEIIIIITKNNLQMNNTHIKSKNNN